MVLDNALPRLKIGTIGIRHEDTQHPARSNWISPSINADSLQHWTWLAFRMCHVLRRQSRGQGGSGIAKCRSVQVLPDPKMKLCPSAKGLSSWSLGVDVDGVPHEGSQDKVGPLAYKIRLQYVDLSVQSRRRQQNAITTMLKSGISMSMRVLETRWALGRMTVPWFTASARSSSHQAAPPSHHRSTTPLCRPPTLLQHG